MADRGKIRFLWSSVDGIWAGLRTALERSERSGDWQIFIAELDAVRDRLQDLHDAAEALDREG